MSQERSSRFKKALHDISMFTSEQNKQIQAIKSDIYMHAELCKKESAAFKEKFGDEWKNLASIQHTLRVVNSNLMLLDKKIELNETFIADIYDRLGKLGELIGELHDGRET